jgi:hypothetical protein
VPGVRHPPRSWKSGVTQNCGLLKKIAKWAVGAAGR